MMPLWKSAETALVSTKGQVVIPEPLRRRYHIEKGTRICFFVQGNDIVLRPITSNYISRLRGVLGTHGKALTMLLEERKKDRKLEGKKRGRKSKT